MPKPNLLQAYAGKRDFSQSPEPAAIVRCACRTVPTFVVQMHAATRLHWDLRPELGGVLKSWVVTRGQGLDPADRRLAVEAEDHPVDCATFEDVIPPGYGQDEVIVWDRGTWSPVGEDRPRAFAAL